MPFCGYGSGLYGRGVYGISEPCGSQGVYWGPHYFGANYFGPRYFPGGGLNYGHYFGRHYFGQEYFGPRYFPGQPWITLAFHRDGIGTRVFIATPVVGPGGVFRRDGTATRRWPADNGRIGTLRRRGIGNRNWVALTVQPPDVFRREGVGLRSWDRPVGSWRRDGEGTRIFTPNVGIADECLTADGERSSGGGGVKNYVF